MLLPASLGDTVHRRSPIMITYQHLKASDFKYVDVFCYWLPFSKAKNGILMSKITKQLHPTEKVRKLLE